MANEVNFDSIPARILRAQELIQNITKADWNSYAEFYYTSAESMISEARETLHKVGLLVRRTDWTVRDDDVVVQNIIIEAPDLGATENHTIEFPLVVGKGKPRDKACATALTSALSYWLRDLLLIPRVSPEDEMHARADEDVELLSDEQAAEILSLIEKIGDDTLLEKILQWQHIPELRQMQASQYRVVVGRLKKRLEQ